MAARAPELDPDRLHRVLVRVHAGLEGDLRLETLAEEAGLSRAHFQRRFRAAAGESPTQFVARVRVERAAHLLCATEDSALAIALAVGFRNADTFTRAFRRRFACSPRAFRSRRRFAETLADVRAVGGGGDSPTFSLSATRLVRGRRLTVAFLRHLGPYERVDPALWTRLVAWAKGRGIAHGLCLGIGHDSPSVTRPQKLRFDAGVLVPDGTRPARGVGVQHLEAGLFAVTTHVGAYATLPAAYPEVFQRSMRLPRFRIVGLPCVEFYRDVTVDPRRPASTTEIWLPGRET